MSQASGNDLYCWRENLAKSVDESVDFVMETNLVLYLEKLDIRSEGHLLNACSTYYSQVFGVNTNHVPLFVRQHSLEVCSILSQRGYTHYA